MRSLTRTIATRLLVAAAPFAATTLLLVLEAGDASSAPRSPIAAAISSASDGASDAAADARGEVLPDALTEGGADALSDGRPALDARADAFLDSARPDAGARGDADAEVGRIDAPAVEGGWYPDAPRPIAPDPVPLTSDSVFVLTVTFTKGAISVDRVEREKLPAKQAIVRRFGRFAAELYSGPTLLERVRFDFPLISDDDLAGDVYARGLVTSVKVRIPESERPNKLEIWDRATERRWSFDYPPKLAP